MHHQAVSGVCPFYGNYPPRSESSCPKGDEEVSAFSPSFSLKRGREGTEKQKRMWTLRVEGGGQQKSNKQTTGLSFTKGPSFNARFLSAKSFFLE